MLRHAFFSIILAAALTGFGNEKPQNESAVREAAKALMEAYNQRQPEKIGALWAEDGVIFHPLTGETSTGREEIIEYYKNRFAKHRNGKVDITVTSVEFDEPNQAALKGLIKIFSSNRPLTQSAFKAQLVSENGKWLFRKITDIVLEPAPSHFNNLQNVDWLVGEWVDQDENIEITFNCKWDKYKNFLIQNFTSKVLGQDQIEGQQIIGWDPIKEKIRSWVFDSDGGFGEGYWHNKDKSWFSHMIYTLPDGRKASAILIYTKIDDHSYAFTSVERDIEGEILPDIDPVVVQKK
ncbi:MAG TPA: SgcJ/EcaC family oxidoreductase [Waddliaceae bacterium]